MRNLVPLAIAGLLAASGCSASIDTASGGRGGHGGSGGDGGTVFTGGGGGDGGTGTTGGCPMGQHDQGGTCVADCATGQHLENGQCVADEVTCAAEFPCPMNQQCVGGRCVDVPGPCANNDQCPTGDVCVAGACQATCSANAQCKVDADCGASSLCVQCQCVSISQCATPTPSLAGAPWAVHQDLHLDQALGAFGKTIAGVLKKLRDAILGCPAGSSSSCFLFELVVPYIPQWAQTLIVAVGNFADVLDNHDFLVDSTMTFTPNGKPSGYDGVDDWNMLTFSYQNQVVMAAPQNVPQIGQKVSIPFQASAVCGVLYVDKHAVKGVLAGILKWIVDTVVELNTCQNPNANVCYHSLSDAITGSIDCSQVTDTSAQIACIGFTSGLGSAIDSALSQWLLDYSLMTLKGTADVASGKSLTNGHWDGTLGNGNTIFNNFDGEWSASR